VFYDRIKTNINKKIFMEYAIVEIGGKQVWVEEGQYFVTNKILTEPGSNISLTRVLLVKKNDEVHVGDPYLKDSKVIGQVVEHFSGPKLIVYKMKSKKKFRRKKGHRQAMTKLLINTIGV
jgi:large subunit ribosomal protein L21|tara:strand:+ start:380 stop:739 length:360 start_codon:yes stop_codon:yes gene_type:complete